MFHAKVDSGAENENSSIIFLFSNGSPCTDNYNLCDVRSAGV